MITTTDIVEQLNRVYYNEETWHKTKLEPQEATKYHQRMLEKGNIIFYREYGELLGYVEFWRVNYEQFGRIVCNSQMFSAYLEDVCNGNICYVANLWVKQSERRNSVFKVLKTSFFLANRNCEYFVGERRTKKNSPLKVYTRQEFIKELGG